MIIAGIYTPEGIIKSSLIGGILSVIFMSIPIIVYYAYSKKIGQIIATKSINLLFMVSCFFTIVHSCWPYIIFPFLFFGGITALIILLLIKSELTAIKKVLLTLTMILTILMNSRVVIELDRSLKGF